MNRQVRAIPLVIVMLLLATLACNLTETDEEAEPTATTRPSVAILSPSQNTTVGVRSEITVEIRAGDTRGSGIQRTELFVGEVGQPIADESVDREIFTPAQSTVTSTLRWYPQVPGSYQLVARASRSDGVYNEQAITVNVSGTATTITPQLTSTPAGTGGGFTPAPPDNTCRARIEVETLNFRSSPNTDSQDNIIGTFSRGDEPAITGRLADSTWYQVQDTATLNRGWIFAQYSTRLGACSASVNTIRVINIQPAVTPTIAPSVTPAPTVTSVPIQPADLEVRITGEQNVTLDSQTGTATRNYILEIQNIGGSDSGAFQAQVILPGGTEQVFDVPGLAPGASIILPDSGGLTVEFTRTGQQQISFRADYQNIVAEVNEANNLVVYTVEVSGDSDFGPTDGE